MAEESLMSEDKEELKKRLEQLQREYERTAQRLQRAERKEEVRRHVQNRISDQNRLLQINTLSSSQTGCASNFVSNSENLLSNQTLPLGTKSEDGFLSAKKIPLVRFHLPDESDTSPYSTPTCRRGPTHRLRSKRSRLRLQSREKESDTDSQEKEREGVEERLREQIVQKKADNEWINQESRMDMESVGEKENSKTDRGNTEEEINQNGWEEKGSDGETVEEKQRKEWTDGLKNREDISDVRIQMSTNAPLKSAPDNCLLNPSHVEVFPVSQLEEITPANQSAKRDSQSKLTTSVLSDQSNDQNEVDIKDVVSGAEKACGDVMAGSSSEKTGFLESCTLIEGLPFPVEYYIRTTRRMAAAHSPVDLDAVIYSQLSRGRGRRRSSLSQKQAAGQLSSSPSQPDARTLDQPTQRGRGKRGRRGRRRTKQPVSKTSSPAVPSAGSCSEQSDSLPESEPVTQSLLQSQSHFTVEPLPRAKEEEEVSQAEPVPTLETAMNTQPAATDFKHLSDSQLYLDCKLLPDSEVYPIFRRRHSQRETVLTSQAQTSTNDSTPNLLTLASLAEYLKIKNFRDLGQMLTTFDIQDFHLPDDEFGQLKLERLRMSCSNLEPLILQSSGYNTRHSRRSHTLRSWNRGNTELMYPESEWLIKEPLSPSASLDCSFPLSQISSAEQLGVTEKSEQSEEQTTYKKPSKQLQSKTGSQKCCPPGITYSGQEKDLEVDKAVKLSSTDQLDQSSSVKENIQTSMAELPKLQTSASEDKKIALDKKQGLELGENTHNNTFLETEPHMHKQNESPSPIDAGSHCPAVLNFSMSLTSHTQQHGPDASLPALGITPHFLTPTSPSVLPNPLSSPSEKRFALCSSQLAEHVAPALATSSSTPGTSQNVCQAVAQTESQNRAEIQTPSMLAETSEAASEFLLSPKMKSLAQCISNTFNNAISENEGGTKDKLEAKAQCQGITQFNSISDYEILDQTENQMSQRQTEPKLEDQPQSGNLSPPHSASVAKNGGSWTKACNITVIPALPDALTNHKADGVDISTSNSSMLTKDMSGMTQLISQADENLCQPIDTSHHSDEEISCGCLQKTHTLKALEGGCVLDMCLVQWPSDDWCICVAGEWSVCVWAQKSGVQLWKLLHTWTFTQSVISLQGIPDSAGLLCVSLGGPEVTEARILCCPSINGEFSQVELYKGGLQTVLAVSDCRLVCCSATGAQQKVKVFTLTQESRIAHTLCLASTNQSIQDLAVVENKKDALVGWTECKTVLIWNMKTGQMLQAVQLAEAVPGATCLKGYSHRGVLCVLLQNPNVCDGNDSPLFTLIAINPLTCKYCTLTSISNTERLVDASICESMLVGVFQSGHLTIWDLRAGVSSVVEGGAGQLCQLARWAGPNTLLTGHQNGVIHLYQYKPVKT